MCVRVPILYDFSNRVVETILTVWYFCAALINKKKLSNLCMDTCLLEPNVATYAPDRATFHWVPVPRQESERSCIYISCICARVSIVFSVSIIFSIRIWNLFDSGVFFSHYISTLYLDIEYPNDDFLLHALWSLTVCDDLKLNHSVK
jgi:hypothetical protein